MAYVTSFPPSGSPGLCSPSGVIGSNSMQTGVALPGWNGKVFNYIANTAGTALLYISFGQPVSSGQFHVVIPPSGNPFTDPGMIKVPIYVSGGSYVAWSM